MKGVISKYIFPVLVALIVAGGVFSLTNAAPTAAPVSLGGTASTTLTGILKGNGTGPVQTAVPGTDYQAPVSATSPITFLANTIACLAASGSQAGCLSSVDWASFNARLSSTTLGLFDKGFFFSSTSADTWEATKGYSTAGFPFTPTTNFGVNTSATTTPIFAIGGLFASSTSRLATTTIGSLNGALWVEGSMLPKTQAGVALALQQCGSNGIGKVYISAGTYTLTSALSVPSNCIVAGVASSTVFRPQSAMAAFDINGKSNVSIRDIQVDGADNATAASSYGIRVLNSSDVRLQNIEILRCAGFCAFIQAGSNSTTTRVWLTDSYLTGRGNRDVIGGGPSNSTNSVVSEVYIDKVTAVQDVTVNSYENAFDIVKMRGIHITNSTFYGIVQPGTEQFAHETNDISHNFIYPAIGGTETQLFLTTNDAATSDAVRFTLIGNTIVNGEIKIVGTSTSIMKDLVVSDNNVKTVSSIQNGISFYWAQGGTVTGNRVSNASSCLYFEDSGNFIVEGNDLGKCSYGIQDATGTSSIKLGFNNFHDITNQHHRGIAQGLFINMDDASSTNPIALTVQSSSASSTLRLINTNGSGRAALEFYDPSQTAPAGRFQFRNLSDALSIFRGVLGSSASEKFRISAAGATTSAIAVHPLSGGLFTGLPTFYVNPSGHASTTQLFGAGLSSCNSPTSALTWAAGAFGCNSISGGSGGSSLSSWATTTSTVAGRFINYSLNNTDIVTIGSNATTTAKFYFDPNTGEAVFNSGGSATSTLSIGQSGNQACTQTWDTSDAAYSHSWTDAGILYIDTGPCP